MIIYLWSCIRKNDFTFNYGSVLKSYTTYLPIINIYLRNTLN